MRPTTIYGYKNKEKYIECFYKIKVKNFNIMQYLEWKDNIDSLPLALRTKNDIYKFLKSILNFGVKWHGFNFNDDFFVCSDCRPIADSTLYLYRSNMADKAGLKRIRIHDFRHSCASLLINNGANVTLVAKYLGHTKIEETLNTYSHMFSTALDSVVSVIDSLEDN